MASQTLSKKGVSRSGHCWSICLREINRVQRVGSQLTLVVRALVTYLYKSGYGAMGGPKTILLQQVKRRMAREGEEASRDCPFQNLIAEGKEKKVTRGEFQVKGGLFVCVI